MYTGHHPINEPATRLDGVVTVGWHMVDQLKPAEPKCGWPMADDQSTWFPARRADLPIRSEIQNLSVEEHHLIEDPTFSNNTETEYLSPKELING